MGKKKVSSARKNPTTAEVRRGLVVVELTRKGRGWFDSKGREYESVTDTRGNVAYYLKKAHLHSGKVYHGVCSQNPKHHFTGDTKPPRGVCECGGKYEFTVIKPSDEPVTDTESKKDTTTARKKKRGK